VPEQLCHPCRGELAQALTGALQVCRATCADILKHPWLKQEGQANDKPLDNVVLSRMKNFAAMNKLKKTALMVIGSCLSAEEIAGMKRLFKTIDADGSGTITVKELQVL
jgi:calcium-dependent protein kinase